MDAVIDRDWKQTVGFTINYHSGQSSEDEFDEDDVVVQSPQHRKSSGYLLNDGGDGAPADLLGTTPPRARIRNKEKRRTVRSQMDTDMTLNRLLRNNRSNTVDNICTNETASQAPEPPDRMKKRASLKAQRTRERDMKLDISGTAIREHSLPSSYPKEMPPSVPTLVDSCSRFKSLFSKLKCKEDQYTDKVTEASGEKTEEVAEEENIPTCRINFHKTFSMLIRMGNIDKSCRRAISMEEQVWQNELKDLIWLELQARVSNRTLSQQDSYLCSQREIVPTIVQNVINYRFVNPKPCKTHSSHIIHSEEISNKNDELSSNNVKDLENSPGNADEERYQLFGCLAFNCQSCSDAIGKALKELGTLLDSFYNAEALYPSSKVMATHHPLIATQLFNNRLKAMCLWYNIVLHTRMKILGVRRLVQVMQYKANSKQHVDRLTSSDWDVCSDTPRPCLVRFNMENVNPSDSSNSDSSSKSESNIPPKEDCDETDHRAVSSEIDMEHKNKYESNLSQSFPQSNGSNSGSNYNGTVDTTVSTESGYLSDKSNISAYMWNYRDDQYDVYNLGPLEEVTMLHLLGRSAVSPYRNYHCEILKTQGVRRSMMFIHKMRKKVLKKVYMTFEKSNSSQSQQYSENELSEMFDDTKDEDDKIESPRYEDFKDTLELRRYGCWSEETLQMRLPSYRNHFLLLTTICMEAVHDYLCIRLETQPIKPSCLTVKQLIHELKEGLDIATEMRSAFVRNIDIALSGYDSTGEAKEDFVKVIQIFDNTVEKVLMQYLSYLTTMSEVEHMARSFLETEWGFTARLAKRMRCAADSAPVSFSDIICNQINSIIQRFSEKFMQLTKHEENIPEDSDDIEAKRHFVYSVCREAQNIYSSERELTIQTVQFSRLLATRLKKNSNFFHCRSRIFENLMRIRSCIVLHTEKIVEKTGIAPWDDVTPELAEGLTSRIRELLLQVYKLGFEFHKEMHRFVNDMQNDKTKAANLAVQSRQISVNAIMKGCKPKLMRSESIGGDNYDIGIFDDCSQTTTSIDCGVPEMRFEEEEMRKNSFASAISEAKRRDKPTSNDELDIARKREESEWAVEVSRAIIDFAKYWMKFVMERCDRGRGLRPRWASQGLEFLMLACEPCNTKHLSDTEFEELKNLMDVCISHVIGSRPSGPNLVEPVATPPPQRRSHRHRIHSPLIQVQNKCKDVPTPPTPPSEPDPIVNYHVQEETLHSRRVIEATQELDQSRDDKLRKMKALGRVVESTSVNSYEPKLRQVTFKWQRGLKIGAGTFGKVYTVVNTESCHLLAMKEVGIGVGDRRALQKAANELKVLEGIIHPHLVRHYGCEIHREEMLIFMELCVEGSLEALLASTGNGLPEQQVRRYTKQLVSAIIELHSRKIAHRDIKSGNIFLTNEGHCLKLGDFGCAVKIRANTTAAGELQGCVGTQAYMAPEVFMKSSGHGRAADIWSLGCVVTEMASGKRPFFEYDSNYQIMFVVGMGGRPNIPSTLSNEGQEFCMSCLTHDPEERPKAQDLKLHHFLMVKSDEDCQCESGYILPNS